MLAVFVVSARKRSPDGRAGIDPVRVQGGGVGADDRHTAAETTPACRAVLHGLPACEPDYFVGGFALSLLGSPCGRRNVEVAGAGFLSAFGFLASRLPCCLLPLPMIAPPVAVLSGRDLPMDDRLRGWRRLCRWGTSKRRGATAYKRRYTNSVSFRSGYAGLRRIRRARGQAAL